MKKRELSITALDQRVYQHLVATRQVTDARAFHGNVNGEVNLLNAKAAPITTDLLVIEDSEAAWGKKKITIGSLPTGSGGGGSKIQDADADTNVDTEAVTNENKVHVKVAGVERGLFQTTTPHVQLTGDLAVSGHAGVFAFAPNANTYLRTGTDAAVDGMQALEASIGSTAGGSAGTVKGVGGYCVAKQPSTQSALGLDYIAGMSGINLSMAIACRVQVYAAGSGKTLSTGYGIWIRNPIRIFATITTAYGLYIENTNAAGTNLAIEAAGPTAGVPLLRLVSGANPATNGTQLYLAVNLGGTVALRQIEVGPANSGGTGYRYLRVLN